jgi:hypothetical protein
MRLELWLVDLVMSCFFLGCIVKDVGNCGYVDGCMDVGSHLPPFTEFLTKECDSGFYWSMVETKEVYFENRLPETRGFA